MADPIVNSQHILNFSVLLFSINQVHHICIYHVSMTENVFYLAIILTFSLKRLFEIIRDIRNNTKDYTLYFNE